MCGCIALLCFIMSECMEREWHSTDMARPLSRWGRAPHTLLLYGDHAVCKAHSRMHWRHEKLCSVAGLTCRDLSLRSCPDRILSARRCLARSSCVSCIAATSDRRPCTSSTAKKGRAATRAPSCCFQCPRVPASSCTWAVVARADMAARHCRHTHLARRRSAADSHRATSCGVATGHMSAPTLSSR